MAVKKEFAPLPTSKATNLLELFQDLRKVIEEEPNRFRMDSVISFVKGRDCYGHEMPERHPFASLLPPCGTIGCYKGWLELMAFGNDQLTLARTPLMKSDIGYYVGHYDMDLAKKMNRYGGLFYNFVPFRSSNPDEWGNVKMLKFGTPEYQVKSLEVLEEFIEEFAERLQAIPITINPQGPASS